MKTFANFILLCLALLGFIGGLGYCGYTGAWVPAVGILALGWFASEKVLNTFKKTFM